MVKKEQQNKNAKDIPAVALSNKWALEAFTSYFRVNRGKNKHNKKSKY